MAGDRRCCRPGTPEAGLVSYNMLSSDYDGFEAYQNRWPQRLPRIVELLNAMQPDLICTQELTQNQLQQLLEQIGDRYQVAGSDQSMAYTLVRRDRLTIDEVHNLQIDVAPTYEPRLSLVVLTDQVTGQQFAVANTHFAFGRIESRAQETLWVAQNLAPVQKEMPIVFCGDLNTFPMRLDMTRLPAYDGDWSQRQLIRAGFQDARDASILGHLGPISTFTNEGEDPASFRSTGHPGVILDHIYIAGDVQVLIHGVESALVNGHFPSDHMPVVADLLIGQPEEDQVVVPDAELEQATQLPASA